MGDARRRVSRWAGGHQLSACRLHLLPDLGRDGLRRVRDRCVLPPDPRLASSHHDDHRAGPGRPRTRRVDPRRTSNLADRSATDTSTGRRRRRW